MVSARTQSALFGDGAAPVVLSWKVVVDTREQAPFGFLGMQDEKTQRPLIVNLITDRALKSGDYSIDGMESRVAVERKSVPDFFSSISAGRDRFEAEMQRLAEMEFAAVVIEGDWRELLIDRPSRTQVSGKVASRTIASWSMRYGVHFFPCMNRRHAELFTFQLLSMFRRNDEREKEQEELASRAGILDLSGIEIPSLPESTEENTGSHTGS